MKPSHIPGLITRIGPTPPLAALIFAGAGLEAARSFGQQDVIPHSPALFYAFVGSAVLFTWISLIWLCWFIARGLFRLFSSRASRPLAWTVISLAAWIIAMAYTAAWGSRLYTGVFPNFDSLRMAQTDAGSAFIVSFLKDTAPGALKWFSVVAGISIIGIPLATAYALRREWDKSVRPSAGKVSLYVWLVSGGAAVCCLGYIVSGPDFFNRRAQLRYISAAVSPPVTLAASTVEKIITRETIAPKLSEEARLAIGPAPVPDEAWKSTKHPNVLYLTVESLRSDFLLKIENGVEIMPHTNELVRRGFYFKNGYAQATHTDYAVPAYLSSLYTLRTPDHYYYEEDAPWPKVLIYDYLADHGYTAGVISSDNTAWGKMRNFMRSDKLDVFFDSENLPTTFTTSAANNGYVSSMKKVTANGAQTAADYKTVDIALAWMQNQISAQKPFVLHTMLQGTHFPYELRSDYPAPFQPADTSTFKFTLFKCPIDKVPILRNAYLNTAHAVDIEIGRIIKFLKDSGQFENTIIVFTGDHGEAFDEQGLMAHAGPNIEPVVRAPMFIFDPRTTGSLVEYPTEQVDMAPTLCGLLGLDPHPCFQGIDVLKEDRPPLEYRNTYISTAVPGFWKGDCVINAGRWKFWSDLLNHKEELFDLQNDPNEEYDLLASQTEIAKALRTHLATWRQNQLAYYKYPMFYNKYYPPRPLKLAEPVKESGQ